MFYRKAHILLFGFLYIFLAPVSAQDQKLADSLSIIYKQNILTDTAKLELLRSLSFNETRDLNKGLEYAEELVRLSEKAGNDTYLRRGYFLKGNKKKSQGHLAEALEAYFKSAEIARKTNHMAAEAETYSVIADTYSIAGNHDNAVSYYQRAINTLRQSNNSNSLAKAILNAGDEFRKAKKYDTALVYFEEAKLIFEKDNDSSGIAYSIGNIGMVYASTGKNNPAENNLNQAIKMLEEMEDYSPVCDYLLALADVSESKGDRQAALNHTLKSLRLAEQYGGKEQIRDAHLKLSELYKTTGNFSEALTHYKTHIVYRDSLKDVQTVQKMADLRFNYETSKNSADLKLLNEQKRNQNTLIISLVIILGLAIIILGILFSNNRNKQKAYKILDLQKLETDTQRAKAEAALTELQDTQKQLIQSAKMASLGELTAGIAHEIQNPLNFVNNFSELGVELLGELKEVTVNKLPASDKAGADDIINQLADNLKKITAHGKRADSIVKGMLLHSRTSTGKKEPIDINALADEYLRLSYHGLRAKNKEFNAGFTTHFDDTIGKLQLVPQDIGRVLLNLYNNAFYAVHEKKKQAKDAFEPHVSVTTERVGNKIELSIKDNGLGIPKIALDKIFQPFFTTKPTGQGTGLGLSLSYDIVQAHKGEIKVETKEGEFTEFIIQLPIDTISR